MSYQSAPNLAGLDHYAASKKSSGGVGPNQFEMFMDTKVDRNGNPYMTEFHQSVIPAGPGVPPPHQLSCGGAPPGAGDSLADNLPPSYSGLTRASFLGLPMQQQMATIDNKDDVEASSTDNAFCSTSYADHDRKTLLDFADETTMHGARLVVN